MRVALLVLVLLVSSGLIFSSAYSRSNGGSSSNPVAPDYETHVVINEVELNPPGNNSGYEWVELLNPTASPVNITGWSISSTAGNRTTTVSIQNTTIPPYGYWNYTHPRQWLDDNNECVVLYDASQSEIDRTPLLNDPDNDTKSCSRYPDGARDWKFKSSTKGESNSAGDIDGNGKVDMWDLASIAKLFGSASGDILWHLRVDIRCDFIINMADLGIAASHFGERYP
jgi:hypothetical protein